jgi:uncharacterized protein (UPF0548 family)
MLVPRGRTVRDGALLLDEMRGAALTYPEVGATATQLPLGYRHGHHRRVLQSNDPDLTFERAVDGLRTWQPHRRAGVMPFGTPQIAVGETVLLVLPIAVAEVRIACRILDVINEPGRFGFTYGTLPCHPECGEERFMVERTGTDVVFTIDVFWKPAHLLSRLAGPVATAMQRRSTEAYLKGLEEYVQHGS